MKSIYFFLIFILSITSAKSQALEVGLGAGAITYRGDLNPNFNPLVSRPGVNAMVRYNFFRAFSAKAEVIYGKISGNDALSTNPLNNARDWSFSGQVFDWNAALEYNFLNFRSKGTRLKSSWSPILFAGAGQFRVFKNSLNADLSSVIYGFDNPKLMLSYGFGFKKEIGPAWNLSATMGARLPLNKESRDLLDGFGYDEQDLPIREYPYNASLFAQALSPNTHTRDTYYYTSITISYVFQGIKCPAPRR